jgi:hypothetical protein
MGACDSRENLAAFAGGIVLALTVSVFLYARRQRQKAALEAFERAQTGGHAAVEGRSETVAMVVSSAAAGAVAHGFAWGLPASAAGWAMLVLSAAVCAASAYWGYRTARQSGTRDRTLR